MAFDRLRLNGWEVAVRPFDGLRANGGTKAARMVASGYNASSRVRKVAA